MEEDPQIMEAEAAVRLLIEQKMQTPINRRQFLQRAGSGVVMSTFGVSLLAACGGGDGDGGGAGGGEVGGTLRMVIWDGYDDKKAFQPFLDKHGVKTQPTYIGNNEEIFTATSRSSTTPTCWSRSTTRSSRTRRAISRTSTSPTGTPSTARPTRRRFSGAPIP
jgi:hypothetical protein